MGNPDPPAVQISNEIRVQSPVRQGAGLLIVVTGMLLLFLPQGSPYFVLGVFTGTLCMIGVTIWLTRYRGLFKPNSKTITIGMLSAFGLYGIFLAGSFGISFLHPAGIQPSSESSIYGLIASHPRVLQIIILGVDAFGFESYFRGTLQRYLATKVGTRRGAVAVLIAALTDAAIHVISLNPLWVITTFIADSVWGANYLYTKDLTSNTLSHFVWDVVIFVIAPIK